MGSVASEGKENHPVVEKEIKKKKRKSGVNKEFSAFLTSVRKEDGAEAIGLSNSASILLNDLFAKLADKLLTTTMKMADYDKKTTVKNRHVATAGNLLLIGPLSSHAAAAGEAALAAFKKAEGGEAVEESKADEKEEEEEEEKDEEQ